MELIITLLDPYPEPDPKHCTPALQSVESFLRSWPHIYHKLYRTSITTIILHPAKKFRIRSAALLLVRVYCGGHCCWLARPPPRCDVLGDEAELTTSTDQLFIDLDSRPSPPPPPSSYLSPPPLTAEGGGGGPDCVEAVATSLQDFSLVNNNNNNNSSSSLSPCQKEQ